MIKEEYIQELPSDDALVEFIVNSPVPVNKRDIARKFKLKGQSRVAIKRVLRELEEAGKIEKDFKKNYKAPQSLPERCLIKICGFDIDGELLAKPADWNGVTEPPKIFVKARSVELSDFKINDVVLAHLKKTQSGLYQARILKKDSAVERVTHIGLFKNQKQGATILHVDKKNKDNFYIPAEFTEEAEEGNLVLVEELPDSYKYPRGKKAVRVLEILGDKDDPKLISLIAINSHGIPSHFSSELLEEAEKFEEPDLKGRVDMREVPLVTIDGADARDFDDAIFAEPDSNPNNEGGWHLIVAIADVSYYVRPGSALDKEAYTRGNSTYFADRVVPMLPERLSNDLCSLKPNVNRACMACDIIIDKHGRMLSYKFKRGLMRSIARLIYEEVEEAHLGRFNDKTEGIYEPVIKPLYEAYKILKAAREKRGSLEIDLPERKAIIDDKGNVVAIVPRERLESHQLVEEFMILANVAAASALEDKDAPCVYRVHDRPSAEKLDSTRDFLKELGFALPKGDATQPKAINNILISSAKTDKKALVHTLLLRTQCQALYSPENHGHFGLALERYAHFTSPIRRYADLLVHRSMAKAYKLGDGQLTDREEALLVEISEHISSTERRSMLAERDVMDRFCAQYLSSQIGKEFKGSISGVTNFGLFVTLDESGADGIVPIRTLPNDYYFHDEKRHCLVGEKTKRTYSLADRVDVVLIEANSLTGSTVLQLVESLGNIKSRANFSRDKGKYMRKDKKDTKRKYSPKKSKKPKK